MNAEKWAERTTDATARARAGGRRRHNRERQEAAQVRRARVATLLAVYGITTRGVQARIARELGVSRQTLTRDVRAILTECAVCPFCHTPFHAAPSNWMNGLCWALTHYAPEKRAETPEVVQKWRG